MIHFAPGETKQVDVTLTPLPTATVAGVIDNASTGAVISGALIEIIETEQSATSNDNGKFNFSSVLANIPLTIIFSAAGYEIVEKSITLNPDTYYSFPIHLTPIPPEQVTGVFGRATGYC